MCRGNQGRNIFTGQEEADLFVRCLGEMCVRNQVVVHAWCLMSNHYHLLLETPPGNLVDAMKWLQGTFTQRYNARHQLWGHLFQGRYQAKVIDDSDPAYFRTGGEYIHRHPAEAGLVAAGGLDRYPWSSYPLYLAPPTKRPDWLSVREVLRACGLPGDSSKSRRAFAAYMDLRHWALVLDKRSADERSQWRQMERGWVHGCREFRERMGELLLSEGKVSEEREQKRDLGEAAARRVLVRCLDYFGLVSSDLPALAKSDPRKLLIAGLLRYHYPVRVRWVSEQLGMGHFTTVSRAMKFYDGAQGEWAEKKQRILRFIG